MRYILFTVLIFFLEWSNGAFCSEVTGERHTDILHDGTVVVTSSRIQRLGESLLIIMKLELSGKIRANESITLLPELNDSLGNFYRLPPIYIHGRKQYLSFLRNRSHNGEDYEVLMRKGEKVQEIRYLRVVPYSFWMGQASLVIKQKECGCDVQLRTSSYPVAELNLLKEYKPRLAYITPVVEVVKTRKEVGRAYLDFPLNKTDIYQDYRANASELAKIRQIVHYVMSDTNVVITHIDIHGYASPEGVYAVNEKLAKERTYALKEYVRTLYAFSDTLFSVRHTAEDWDGFISMLKTDSLLDNRKKILRIAMNGKHPDERESMIRRHFPEEFNYIFKTWFPALRRSDYEIHYVVRPFTVSEAEREFKIHPHRLSLNEMFQLAQEYDQGSEAYNQIFLKAVELYPDNPVANLNAACIALGKGQLETAKNFLKKVPECPEKKLAYGVCRMLEGDFSGAREQFIKARKDGIIQADYNLEILDKMF